MYVDTTGLQGSADELSQDRLRVEKVEALGPEACGRDDGMVSVCEKAIGLY